MFTYTTRPSAPTSTPPPTRDQLVIMGAGALAFIASFLPWVKVSLGFVSGSGNAWQSGLLAWASVLVCAAVTAVVAADTFLGLKLRPLGRFAAGRLLIAGALLAVVLMVARAIWLPSIPGVSIGLGAGFFIAMAASLAQVVSTVRYYKLSQARSLADR
jgi:hypothetical protein